MSTLPNTDLKPVPPKPKARPCGGGCGRTIEPIYHDAVKLYGRTMFEAGWNYPFQRCEECAAKEERRLAEQRHRERIERLIAQSGLDPIHEHMTLENFDPPSGSSIMCHLDAAASLERNLYLQGLAGRGKTHAAVGVLKSFIADRVKPARFWVVSDLLGALRRASGDFREEDELDSLFRYEMLVLDDLGAQRPTDFGLEMLTRIIDRWYRSAKPGLLITSNKGLHALGEALNDGRVPSRLAEMCTIIELGGKDRRLVREQIGTKKRS